MLLKFQHIQAVSYSATSSQVCKSVRYHAEFPFQTQNEITCLVVHIRKKSLFFFAAIQSEDALRITVTAPYEQMEDWADTGKQMWPMYVESMLLSLGIKFMLTICAYHFIREVYGDHSRQD